MLLPQLPIHENLPDIKKYLSEGPLVLSALPGSGKTTIVPLMLLGEHWLEGKKIIILEPRRLAARMAASRMAHLLGEKVGQTVGYQIRFDRKISADTRIEVLTEGILTRRIQNDIELHDIGLIIFDEFHERSLHADLALALCLDLCQIREDLRLLVMSATLDTAEISSLLGNAPVVTGKGKIYEVEIEYLKKRPSSQISDYTAASLRHVIEGRDGDVLVFLPGKGEIMKVMRKLRAKPDFSELQICPLFGNLSQTEQNNALLPDPSGRRRIILSTSIAETSVTIEGVSIVVDSGWSRRPRYNPGNGLTTLTTIRVSKAVADQRTGRAGRLGPGYCLRLWTKEEQYSLLSFDKPEIANVDLSNFALELLLWGVKDPLELKWLDPPNHANYQGSLKLLRSLNALDENNVLTETGKRLGALPIHPRLGYMLLKAQEQNQVPLACDIAAILSERDLLRNTAAYSSVDMQMRLHVLDLYRKKGRHDVEREGGDAQSCKRVNRLSMQWQKKFFVQAGNYDLESVGGLLVHAYPDRIARRRANQKFRYQLSNGRGVIIDSRDFLSSSEYLVVPLMDGGVKEGKIYMAESLDIEIIKKSHPKIFSRNQHVVWNEKSKKVDATERQLAGQIIVDEIQIQKIDADLLSATFMEGIKKMGSECLPWTRNARQLQARVDCLRRWNPQGNWPDLCDSTLMMDLSWLEPYLEGMRRAEHLERLDVSEILNSMLGWERQRKLKQDAPLRVKVPSGSEVAIEYCLGETPILAVRIQEMFGLAESPTICDGRIVLLLHLLSPARRPIQITSDLPGFWQGSYNDVKKELKGRYPKHHWPDDPLQSQALRGVKRKRK